MKLEKHIKNIFKRVKENSWALALSLPLVFSGACIDKAKAGDWGGGYDDSYSRYGYETYLENYKPKSYDFEDYINDRKYDYNRVLIMGVGRTEEPAGYTDYFDKIIPLSEQGNTLVDYTKATGEHFGIPTSNQAFESLKGKRIDQLYVHSWSTDAAVNQIRLGNIQVNNLILLDPVGGYKDWNLPNTNVEAYLAKDSFFRFIPEVRTWQTDNQTIPGVGYTVNFGSGQGNAYMINTTHSLEQCLNAAINLRSQTPQNIVPATTNQTTTIQFLNSTPNWDSYKLTVPQTAIPVYTLPQPNLNSFQNLSLPQTTFPTLNPTTYSTPAVDYNTHQHLTIPQTTIPTFTPTYNYTPPILPGR